jgi:C4-dicarboxylate-specific signal transduction histidine kinase
MAELNDFQELGFFGKVTASCSHELKNVLAVVNENAGLIEDLLELAAKGRTIDPARLMTAAQAVKIQILRGDSIIKNLNRFAHTADEMTADVAVEQAVELTINMAARMASMRGVALTMIPPAESYRVRTSPFALQQLMWCCIDKATASEESRGGAINITIEPAPEGVRIRIKGPAGKGFEPPTNQKDQILLGLIGGKATADPATGEMIITLNPTCGTIKNSFGT